GTYAAYAALMAVLGETTRGIHLGLTFVNVASMGLLFVLGRRLFDPLAGAVAATTFGVLSMTPMVSGTAAHATQFVVVVMLGGIILLDRSLLSKRNTTFFASGFLFGLAILMKQHGAFFGLFGGIWILWTETKSRPIAWKLLLQRVGLFSGGCVLPFLLV